ncbi:hypothetical protein N752_05830 [Desulforamulus aquiferis]|nr:radical SAM protein [Desulforamulus aquiferis]RYD06045.1 hypothetical protein N752_05830 [Desulforamulus aquiferis]
MLRPTKKEWLLRGWSDLPWALVNWRNGDFRELAKDAFYVAQSCDGVTDFESMAFLPRHTAILDKLIAEGVAEECKFGETLEYGQAYRKADNPMIRGLLWSITGLCNMKCRHCFMEASSQRFGDFSIDEIWDLINQFEQANVSEIAITGGEPFMRKELPEILETLTLKKIGLAEIFTNGMLVTDKILETIKLSGNRPFFKISFDGCGTHDYMRGVVGSEVMVIEGIKRVKAWGFPFTIITSVDRITQINLMETYDLMKELEVDEWWLAPPVEVGHWRDSDSNVSLEDMVDLCTRLLQRWLADDRPFNIKLWRFGLFRRAENGENLNIQSSITPDSWNCAGTHSRPYLLPDGTLLPCGGYTGTSLLEKMPNLKKQSLSQAWTNSALRHICDLKKRDVLAHNKGCDGCQYFAACGSGCRVIALGEKGDLLAKDPVACLLFKGGYIKRLQELAKQANYNDQQKNVISQE